MALRKAAVLLSSLAAVPLGLQPDPGELERLLERVGAQVQQYYARAQHIICRETVRLQPLDAGMSSDGLARSLEYDLRVEWQAAADGYPRAATVVRELVRGSRRQLGTPDDPDCFDPKPASPEPLVLLLPARQAEFRFTWSGRDRVDGRDAAIVDYRPLKPGPSIVAWDGGCGSVDVPALVRGRLWIDVASGEVLRLDERLGGQFDFSAPDRQLRLGGSLFFVLERADSTIRYKPVTFADPDETLMLPSSIDSLTVIRNSGVPRMRSHQEFSDYRRFLTSGRILE
jgi:hypothetical protein